MFLLSKRTNRSFESIRSLVNHVRSSPEYSQESNPIEKCYQENHGLISAPVCPFCGTSGLKFDSYRKGYKKSCGSEECVRLCSHRANTKRGLSQRETRNKAIECAIENSEELCLCCGMPKAYNRSTNQFMNTCGSSVCSKNMMFGTDLYISLFDDDKIELDHMKPYGPRKLFSEVKNFLEDVTNKNFSESHYKCFICSKKVREKLNELDFETKFEMSKYSDILRCYFIRNEPLLFELRTPTKTKRISKDTELHLIGEVYFIRNGEFAYPLLSEADSRDKFLRSIGVNINCSKCGENIRYRTWSFDRNFNFRTDKKTSLCHSCLSGLYRFEYEMHGVSDFKNACRDKQSITVKNKILNGTFTPNERCFSISKLEYDGRKYRSSWEIIFAIICNTKGIKFEYETKRFKYIQDGNSRTYIADFFLPETNHIVEIKPSCEILDEENILKSKSVYPHSFEFKTEYDIQNTIDELSDKELSIVFDEIESLDTKCSSLIKRTFNF